jgi:hypothetical protein
VPIAEPAYPWEIAQPAHVLVASALAFARPAILAGGPTRLNGLGDDQVAERYRALFVAVEAIAASVDPAVAGRLATLEEAPLDVGYEPWVSPVSRSGVSNDPAIIRLARAVWDALGPNEYAVQLRQRPHSYRGFAEGRGWITLGVLGLAAIGIATVAAQNQWGAAWLVGVLIGIGWIALLTRRFQRRYARLQRQGGQELPHF